MKVYAVSCETSRFERDLDRILSSLDIEKGSLVLFPEYFLDGPKKYGGIRRDDNLLINCLNFAKSKEIYLALGMIEKLNDKKYIKGVLIDQRGDIIGEQKKINPTFFDKEGGISPGLQTVEVINTKFGKVSFTICFDQWYFKQGFEPDVRLHPRGFGLNHPSYGYFCKNWRLIDEATAILNKAYVIGTTGADGKSPLSDIITFEGRILAESKKPGIISADIDLDLLRKYKRGEYTSKFVPLF